MRSSHKPLLKYALAAIVLGAGMLALPTRCAYAQITFATPEMPDVRPGEHVSVRLRELPNEAVKVLISSDGTKDTMLAPVIATIDPTSKTASFLVGEDVRPGRYLIAIVTGEKVEQVPGELRVQALSTAPIQLESIYPVIQYPDGNQIEIIGSNLARVAADNVVDFVDRPMPEFGSEKECNDSKLAGHYTKACLETVANSEGHRLRIVGPLGLLGPVLVRVRIGKNGPWSNTANVTFAVDSTRKIRAWATLGLILVGLAVFALARLAAEVQPTGGHRYGALAVLLLDRETDTFSLSKFQLLVWTGVFVFSYLYLALCRALVQYSLEWPPVPDNMPELLGLSAGAGVLAAGITAVRGSKGAGGMRPTYADFITSGGIVVGERLQYFIWTVVGAVVFLYLVVQSDPARFQKLPDIPSAFLYLISFSSAAYLGGKIARKPGPVVKNISVLNANERANGEADIRISLQGENLHSNASFKIGGEPIRPDKITNEENVPKDSPDGFCTERKLSIAGPSKYLEGKHVLTYTNPDGQSADVNFPISPLTITAPVDPLKAGNTATTFRVVGENFIGDITAQWKNASGNSAAVDSVKRVSSTELDITLIPGPQGQGQLTLKSAVGLKVCVDVTVNG